MLLNDGLWDKWSRIKTYNNQQLQMYYQIRERNVQWMTSLSLSLLDKKRDIRILKTDLWNEAKKDEAFFTGRKEFKCGIDISGDICNMAKLKYNKLPVIQGSISSLPFAEFSFDLIWDISTIDHYKNPKKVINEYYHALDHGGILLLVVENPFCASYPITKIQSFFGYHVPFRTFRPSLIVQLCKKAGFSILRSFKTNVHLPTWVVYPLEKKGQLDKINRNQNFFWQYFKKYFVVLAHKQISDASKYGIPISTSAQDPP